MPTGAVGIGSAVGIASYSGSVQQQPMRKIEAATLVLQRGKENMTVSR